MYEKTIASDFRIYKINLESTWNTVYNLLDDDSKLDYNQINYNNGLISNPVISGRPHAKYKRSPVDGYIVSSNYDLHISCDFSNNLDLSDEVYEVYAAGVEYTVPVWHWPIKTWVKTSNTQDTAIIRIFFS